MSVSHKPVSLKQWDRDPMLPHIRLSLYKARCMNLASSFPPRATYSPTRTPALLVLGMPVGAGLVASSWENQFYHPP